MHMSHLKCTHAVKHNKLKQKAQQIFIGGMASGELGKIFWFLSSERLSNLQIMQWLKDKRAHKYELN